MLEDLRARVAEGIVLSDDVIWFSDTATLGNGLFDLLGFQTREGRAFHREEHQSGRGGVAVLDHGFWTRQFGGASAVGRSSCTKSEA